MEKVRKKQNRGLLKQLLRKVRIIMPPKSYIIPIFIPHEGCPHDCSFCNQRKIAGESSSIDQQDVRNIIDKYLGMYPKLSKNIEVAFYGGSFTGLPIEKQIQLLKPAYEVKKKGLIQEIRLSTRPDYIHQEVLSLLEDYGVSIIELGLQSTDDHVLSLNRRGHTREDIIRAVNLVKQWNFKLGLQMMVGLYGDSETSIKKTAEDIICLRPDFIRIYPTVVIQDTYLEILYKQGIYSPYTLDEVVAICKDLLIKFKKNNIPVIRLGLQSTEDINIGKAVVAGPYHPAFREIVESEIYRDMIEQQLLECETYQYKELIVHCHSSVVSRVAGYQRSNKKYFIEKYNFTKIIIKHSFHREQDSIEIELR